MPQFNPEWFASQIFWLAVTFIVLYLLMSRIALPRVAQIIEDRQEKVEDDLAKAEKLRSEAQEVYEAYEKSLQEARGEAQKLLKQTQDEIAQHQAERHEAFSKELAKKTDEAEARIDKAKTEALNNIDSVAGEVAQAATAKLIGSKVGKQHAEKAVKDAMGEAS